MKRYSALVRVGLLIMLQLRMGTIVNFLGNIIYIIIIYNLWKSIFLSSGSDVVNGMTFADTMVYLVLASALFYAMEGYLVWRTHHDILSGQIILDLIKPVGYMSYQYFSLIGDIIFNFVTTFIPTFIIVCFLSNFAIPLGLNLLFFLLSVVLAVGIHFCIDFFVGTICLYTQSVWGVNIMKEVVVLLLSGAVIPINFFPEPLKSIVMYLPFQAIYNAPLQQLINAGLPAAERLSMLATQLLWVAVLFVLSRVFWRKSVKIITVNGG